MNEQLNNHNINPQVLIHEYETLFKMSNQPKKDFSKAFQDVDFAFKNYDELKDVNPKNPISTWGHDTVDEVHKWFLEKQKKGGIN